MRTQALLFVLAEEMRSSQRSGPNAVLLWQCGQILAAEVVIDVLKHAVLGRFNEIRPGVYREFMRVSLLGLGFRVQHTINGYGRAADMLGALVRVRAPGHRRHAG